MRQILAVAVIVILGAVAVQAAGAANAKASGPPAFAGTPSTVVVAASGALDPIRPVPRGSRSADGLGSLSLGRLRSVPPAGTASPPPCRPWLAGHREAPGRRVTPAVSSRPLALSVTRKVTAQEALAAAALPGATVSIAPGLSLTQAVGLAPSATLSAIVHPVGAAAAASTGCAANAAWHEWGTWPYQQRVTDTTYWCMVLGDHITYTSSSVTATGTICGTSWTNSQLISGGIGYSWFVMRSSAGWSCATVIPWVTLHPSHYEDVSRNDWGSTAEVGSG